MSTGSVGCIFVPLHLIALLFFGVGLFVTIPLHVIAHMMAAREQKREAADGDPLAPNEPNQ